MKTHLSKGLPLFTMLLILFLTMPALGFQQLGLPQEDDVVARVDGEEIMRSELDQATNIMNIMMQLQQVPQFAQFLQTSEEGQAFLQAYERHILDNLIDERLMEMEAEKRGITISQEEMEAFAQEQIDMIQQQQGLSDDDLLQAVQNQLGLESIEDFKEMIIEQEGGNLLIQKFLSEVVVEEMDITEEEAKDFYDEQGIDAQGIGFADIEMDIKAFMAQEKFVQQLREEADVEIFL